MNQYKRQLCRASEASKEGPKDTNLETRLNSAKFAHPTTVGTPRPTQISGGVVKQIRSKPLANYVSDCVLLPHIKRTVYKLLLPTAQQPLLGQGILITHASRSLSDTPHSVGLLDSSGRVIGPSQRPLPDNTQHSQQTDLYLTTHNTHNRQTTT